MPTLSVVTAAYAPTANFIAETMEGIKAANLPSGWDIEWVVQEDGPNPSLKAQLTEWKNCKYDANNRQLGISSTRNLALTRARGTLIQALDQDDLLLPVVFSTLVPLFNDPAIHWAIGQADDLMPDGSKVRFHTPLPFGKLSAGFINDWAADEGGNWPIHCAALLMRATSLRAIGGWGGIPFDDELSMFAALSEIADGYHHESITWLYRQHSDQIHRTPEAQRWSDQCRRSALQRAKAVRSSGLHFGAVAEIAAERDTSKVNVRPAFKRQRAAESR